MKPTLELQKLIASKLPEKIVFDRQAFWNCDNKHSFDEEFCQPVLDTEWDYIVMRLLEPVMTIEQQKAFIESLGAEISTIDGTPHDFEWAMIHATWQQRTTAMHEIGFFEKGK